MRTYLSTADNQATLPAAAAVATSNIGSLSGLPTIDGYTLQAGDVVLLTAQTTAVNNGLWVAAAGAWSRPAAMATGTAVKSRTVTVVNGTVNKRSEWLLSVASGSITVGTDAQTWVLRQTSSVTGAASSAVYVDSFIGIAANTPAAVQSAINAATNAGTTEGRVVFGAGETYSYAAGSVPTVPPNLPGRGLIVDATGATIVLSAAVPTFLLPGKTANGQSFAYEIVGGDIDGNNVSSLDCVVTGNYIAGGLTSKISVNHLRVRGVRTYNVPSMQTRSDYTTATSHRLNVHWAINDVASQATQYSLTDAIVEDCQFGASGGGGDEGVFLGGTVASAVTGLNVWVDDLHIRRCTWNSGGVPTQFGAQAGFQIGSCAFGGRGTVEACKAIGSADVGIEVDTLMSIDVTDCEAIDCNHPFYGKNIQYVSGAGTAPATSTTAQTYAQTWTFTRCKARKLNLTATSATPIGFRLDIANSVPMGSATFRDCLYQRTTSEWAAVGMEAFYSTANASHVLLDKFTIDIEGVSATGAASGQSLISIDGPGAATFAAKNIRIRFVGSNTSGNIQTLRLIEANATTVSPLTTHLTIDDVFLDWSFTSGSFLVVGANLGTTSTNTISGLIRRFKLDFHSPAPFSSWIGVNVPSTTTLTIPIQERLTIVDCDFGAVNGNPVVVGSGQANAIAIVRCKGGRTIVTAAYTIVNSDDEIACTQVAALTLTLPAASAWPAGKELLIVDESNNASVNNITINRAGADTFLDGTTSKTINTNGGYLRIRTNAGTKWIVVT